jgi:hypothetical protein
MSGTRRQSEASCGSPLIGAGVGHFGSLGTPVALTSIAFALGLLLIPFSEKTRGKILPA